MSLSDPSVRHRQRARDTHLQDGVLEAPEHLPSGGGRRTAQIKAQRVRAAREEEWPPTSERDAQRKKNNRAGVKGARQTAATRRAEESTERERTRATRRCLKTERRGLPVKASAVESTSLRIPPLSSSSADRQERSPAAGERRRLEEGRDA